jgi:hypothetical protein
MKSVEPATPVREVPAELGHHAGTRMQQWVFLATTFVSSFLLFQVQPLIGKIILPWFGGTASVWTICLLFFQIVLFAGYAYAHFSTTRLGAKAHMVLHSGLMLLAITLLPIIPDDAWKPAGSQSPELNVLKVLAVSVGLPFLVLSTTAPLVQRWWSLVHDASPYRLYALSNVGSLLALLSYSFVIEPLMGTTRQAQVWSGMFVALVVMLLGCQFVVWQRERVGHQSLSNQPPMESLARRQGNKTPTAERPTVRRKLSWLLLAALGTIVLMAATNVLCQDVSSVPFLWIGPLTMYLLSFIFCFGQASWYRRSWFLPLMLISSYGCAVSFDGGISMSLYSIIALNLASLFAVCMVCHGELERLKPAAGHLTSFYLYLSAGGMLGGMFVGVLAPVVFQEFYELPIAMITSWLIALGLIIFGPSSPIYLSKKAPGGLRTADCHLVGSLNRSPPWSLDDQSQLLRRTENRGQTAAVTLQHAPGSRSGSRKWSELPSNIGCVAKDF